MIHRPHRHTLTLVCLWIVLILLLSRFSLFTAQWWLEPDHATAAHLCHTLDVRVEHGLEVGFVGYAQHTQGRLYLYSTTVVRETQCHSLADPEHQLTLQYRDVYLNVTHQDVGLAAERLRVLYPKDQAYTAWRYQHWRPHQLDAHGFVLQPLKLDVNESWSVAALQCLLLLAACTVAGVLVCILWYYWPHEAFTWTRRIGD